jgi:MraZ protein
VFQGTSNLTIDAKGRLSMPTRHRDALLAQCEGRLTLTLHPDGCLLVYPRPVWLTRREALGHLNATARDLLRMLIGSASDVEFDSAGRILISPELREEAGLQRDVKLMGVGAYFELWDVERKKARDDAFRASLLDGAAAAGFTF